MHFPSSALPVALPPSVSFSLVPDVPSRYSMHLFVYSKKNVSCLSRVPGPAPGTGDVVVNTVPAIDAHVPVADVESN